MRALATAFERHAFHVLDGVTEGNLLRGVRFFGAGVRTQSLIMTLEDRVVRFIDTVHLEKRPDVKVRFS